MSFRLEPVPLVVGHPVRYDPRGRGSKWRDLVTGKWTRPPKKVVRKVPRVRRRKVRKKKKNRYFCLIKGYRTKRGGTRLAHWGAMSVEVWAEFVLGPRDKVPPESDLIDAIESGIAGSEHSWVLNLTPSGSEWRVEEEKTDEEPTDQIHVTLYRWGYEVLGDFYVDYP